MQNIKIYNAHCCGEIGDVVIGLENLYDRALLGHPLVQFMQDVQFELTTLSNLLIS